MKNKYGDTPIDNIHDKKVLLEYFPELISFKLSEIQANHKVLWFFKVHNLFPYWLHRAKRARWTKRH